MRIVDETTERPVARTLPPPTGRRNPTGAIPLTLPADLASPVVADEPMLPYLPAIIPKASAPSAGTPAILNTELLMPNRPIVPATSAAEATTAKPKRRRICLIALGALVLLLLSMGVVFHNSALVERFTGKGYDTNPLPTHAVPRPAFDGADFTMTTQSVSTFSGLPTNYWTTEHDKVNYPDKVAVSTFSRAKASVIGGNIGTPQLMAPAHDEYSDPQYTYVPGDTPEAPFVRTPLDPGWYQLAVLSRNQVYMYQDVFDPSLRAQKPASVVKEARADTAVTTYTYTFPFGEFYNSAPRLFDLVRVMDGNADDNAKVTVTVSLDTTWMVRYLDVNVDYRAVLEHRANADPDNIYPYRFTLDVTAVTPKPMAVGVPTNIVDATTTTLAPPATDPPPATEVTP
jgi:hypothetical protein